MDAMKQMLMVRDGTPAAAIADYDCSEFGEAFGRLMLAREGFVRHDRHVSAWICKPAILHCDVGEECQRAR